MDDSLASQKKDLIKFIDKEIKNFHEGDTNLEKVYKFFYKCMNKTFYDIYDKIKNIENISIFNTIKNGLNMIYYIFWTLYIYTYNVKLTMFLTERAVLLFTEFIVMSRNPILNKEFRFIPNINDAITFALKKTIGPIKLSTLKSNKKFLEHINIYKSASFMLKYIYIKIIELHFEDKNFDFKKNLDNIISQLNLPIIKLCKNIKNEFIFYNYINKILNRGNNTIENIFYIKLYLEIVNRKLTKQKGNTKDILEKVFKKIFSINLKKNKINIENLVHIKKKSYFKELIFS